MTSARSPVWVSALAAALRALIPAAIGVGFLANVSQAGRPGYHGPGVPVALAVTFVSLGVAAYIAVRTFRRHRCLETEPDRQQGAARHAAPRSVSIRTGLPKAFRPMPSAHPVRPAKLAAVFVVLLAVIGGLSAYTVALHSDSDRSAFVQAQGVPTSATVVSVWNSGYQSRSWDWNQYEAHLAVRLAVPAGAAGGSTVYYPDSWGLTPGDRVRILVDPADPGYAEIPGRPYITSGPWIFMTITVGCLLTLLVAASIGTIADLRRRRRAARY
jgi:hypothetical protein